MDIYLVRPFAAHLKMDSPLACFENILEEPSISLEKTTCLDVFGLDCEIEYSKLPEFDLHQVWAIDSPENHNTQTSVGSRDAVQYFVLLEKILETSTDPDVLDAFELIIRFKTCQVTDYHKKPQRGKLLGEAYKSIFVGLEGESFIHDVYETVFINYICSSINYSELLTIDGDDGKSELIGDAICDGLRIIREIIRCFTNVNDMQEIELVEMMDSIHKSIRTYYSEYSTNISYYYFNTLSDDDIINIIESTFKFRGLIKSMGSACRFHVPSRIQKTEIPLEIANYQVKSIFETLIGPKFGTDEFSESVKSFGYDVIALKSLQFTKLLHYVMALYCYNDKGPTVTQEYITIPIHQINCTAFVRNEYTVEFFSKKNTVTFHVYDKYRTCLFKYENRTLIYMVKFIITLLLGYQHKPKEPWDPYKEIKKDNAVKNSRHGIIDIVCDVEIDYTKLITIKNHSFIMPPFFEETPSWTKIGSSINISRVFGRRPYAPGPENNTMLHSDIRKLKKAYFPNTHYIDSIDAANKDVNSLFRDYLDANGLEEVINPSEYTLLIIGKNLYASVPIDASHFVYLPMVFACKNGGFLSFLEFNKLCQFYPKILRGLADSMDISETCINKLDQAIGRQSCEAAHFYQSPFGFVVKLND